MSKPVKLPSEKQTGFLAAYGQTAATAAEAHEKITGILALPVVEQAKLRVARMDAAISGSGGHNATFHVACVLMHGYALSTAEAMVVMQEYNVRCQPAWSERELAYKLASAEKTAHEKPRGYLLVAESPGGGKSAADSAPYDSHEAPPRAAPSPRKLVDFDPKKLVELAAKWRPVVNVEWLANRSISDPCAIGPRDYLTSLYRPGEKVLLFTVYKSQGQALWPKDEVPVAGAEGVWYLAQPVNGESLPNPRTGRMSRRSMESVTEFRYLVLESDKADVRDWLGLIVQLPLRIEAIYTSGGKSVHALVRVDCPSHRIWEDYVRGLMPTLNLLGMAGVDPKTLTSVRLTRLPGCLRAGKLQKLLFFLPNRGPTDVRPINELAVQRDVTASWLAQSNLVVDGHAETTRELRRALRYYAPCNASCRQALADVGEGL